MNVNIRSLFRTIIYGVLLFMYINEFQFLGTPDLFSSRKIVYIIILILISLSILKKKYIELFCKKELLIVSFFCFYFIGYLLFLTIIYGEFDNPGYVVPRVVYLFLYGILGSVLFANFFNNLESFYKGIAVASVFQSTIVYLQYLFIEVRIFFNNTFVGVGNVSFLREDRVTGLGTANGANLSMLLFCGLFCCGYFIFKKHKIKWFIPYIYILVSILAVARTGFYIGLINLFVILILMFNEKFNFKTFIRFVRVVIISGLTIGGLWILGKKYIDPLRLEHLFTWVLSLGKSRLQDPSVIELSKMEIPQLTFETLLGTSVYRGQSALGTIIQHDSGYIQMYFSLGFINAIIFYLVFLWILTTLIIKIKDQGVRLYFYFFCAIIFIIEIKEPFIVRGILPFVLITSCLLLRKEEKMEYVY